MDIISRLICEELNLRAYTVTSIDAVRKLCKIHGASAAASMALGGTVNAAALASALLKPGSLQSVSVKFHGDGPLREVHAQADARGNIRGYVSNPAADGESFSKAIGAGFLSVVHDLNMREPYSSVLPMVYGSIAADMSYFFTASAQIPSAMILALEADENEITASGGILIQTFPDTPESSIELVENAIRNMNKSLGRSLLDGADITSVAAELMGEKSIEITDETNIQLRCRCSKDMLAETIAGFQREELLAMIEEDHGAEIICSFCKNVYRFNEDELRDILSARCTPIH